MSENTPKKFKENGKGNLWSNLFAGLALLVSILVGTVNYFQAKGATQISEKALEVSEKALDAGGPNIALAEQELRKKSAYEYTFLLPFKNVGNRTAANMTFNYCFIGLKNNQLVAYHGDQQPTNDLAPTVIKESSGSLVINPELNFPEPQFIALDLTYTDSLIDKEIHQRWLYSQRADRPNEFMEVIDPEIERLIQESLHLCF